MKPAPAIKDYVKPLGPYSHAVVANGFVFVSGQTGLKPGGGPARRAGAGRPGPPRHNRCNRGVRAPRRGVRAVPQKDIRARVFVVRTPSIARILETTISPIML